MNGEILALARVCQKPAREQGHVSEPALPYGRASDTCA